MKLTKKQRSILSTVMGGIVAVATAWVTVDFETFAFDFKHIAPLVLSGLVALGGYMTSINSKDNEGN
jgi:hypothetical protein